MFSEEIKIIIPLISGLLMSVISFFLNKYIENRKEKMVEERELIKDKISTINKNIIDKTLSDLPETTRQKMLDFIINTRNLDGAIIETWPINLSKVEQFEIEKKVEERVIPLKRRIEEIERRFPNESTIEKIASVNEAVLATRLENLTEAIKKIESSSITKWDVTVVVLEIVGGLGVIVAIIFGIISLLQP